MSDDLIEQNIKNDINKLGMQLIRVLERSHWKHFPHVSPQSMKKGFHRQLEDLQGKNGTYFAGEVLNFSSVKCCSDTAKHLVNTYF